MHRFPSLIALGIALALNSYSLNAATYDNLLPLASPQHSRNNLSQLGDQYDQSKGSTNFQWAKVDQQRPSLGALSPENRSRSFADFYLEKQYGLSPNAGISEAKLHAIGEHKTGSVIASYGQYISGIEVFNHRINLLMDQEMNYVASSGNFAKIAANAVPPHYGNPQEALQTAVSKLTGLELLDSQISKTVDNYTIWSSQLNDNNISFYQPPRTKPVWFVSSGQLLAAYYVEIEVTDKRSHESQSFAFVIAANSRKILLQHNLVAHSSEFGYRVYADDNGKPWDGPHGNVIPATSINQVDSKTYLDAPLITLPHGPIESDDPWLPENAQVTKGNNVHAYADLVAPDGFNDGDLEAETSAANTFDYPYNPDQPASSEQNRKAALVNLFYLINYLHDEFYAHGFDEASGNAQLSNYGRGGREGDPILAEAQDYSGTNNANMSTPADGYSPRMQMYLWDSKDAEVGQDYGVKLTSHHNIGVLSSSKSAQFGPQKYDVTAQISRIENNLDGCADVTMDLSGKLALINRGSCEYDQQVLNAQKAGAIGVIIANNYNNGHPPSMSGRNSLIEIPSMGISYADGAKIDGVLNQGRVNAQLFNSKLMKGSSFDNGVVAHEWGHYITNRLIGNGSGLINQQGRAMGEGWGDFHALLMLADAEDVHLTGNELFQKAYAATTYVAPFYSGIRNYPYSTNMSINPLTFANVTLGNGTRADRYGNAEVHDAGEPWAAMLWDCFIALVNDPRHSFDEARSRMMDYLVSGYKLTPVSPTYTEARDALLAAANASDFKDYQLMLNAFARRGMGLNAVSPKRESLDLSGVVESYDSTLSDFVITAHQLDADYQGLIGGYCTKDGILDQGETGALSFTIKNQSERNYDHITAKVELKGNQGVRLSNDGVVEFKNLGKNQSLTSSPLTLTLDSVGTQDTLEFVLSFTDLDAGIEVKDYEFSFIANMAFEDKPLANNTTSSDMEDTAALKNFTEQVLSSDQDATGRIILDNRYVNDLPVGNQYLVLKSTPFSSDIAAQTKSFHVNDSGNFSISWFNYYVLEDQWDGGVVEVAIDGGDWQDVQDVGGKFQGRGYNSKINIYFKTRDAFTGNQGGRESIDFGTALNGHDVQLRFRLISDSSTALYGWIIDDVQLNNITTPAFYHIVSGVSEQCEGTQSPLQLTRSSATAKSGEQITLSVSANDALNNRNLTYRWQQTSGTEVTLSSTTSPSVSFSAPSVASSEKLMFTVTVSDGVNSVNQSTEVTIEPDATDPNKGTEGSNSGGSSSGGSLGWAWLALTTLLCRRRAR